MPGAQDVLRAASRVPGVGLLTVPLRVAWVTAGAYVNSLRRPGAGDVPAPAPTAAFVAQVALDESILGLLRNPSRFPTPAEIRRVAGELDTLRELLAHRGYLADPRAFHAPPPPLGAPDIASGFALGLRYERLRWPSDYQPLDGLPGHDRWLGHQANHTAHAWVLRHAGPPRPWLLCFHGLGTGAAFADFFAFRARWLHETLGLNLAFPVLPLHGPRRNTPISGEAFMSYDLPALILGMGQAMWDVRRLLGWVEQQGAPAVGAYGISIGGYTAALLATLEPLDLVLAGVPLADIPALFAGHTPQRLRRMAVNDGMLSERTAEVFQVVSPLAAPPLVPPERRFLYAGLGDRMATLEQARTLWLHWGRPPALWYQGNHLGFMWTKSIHGYVDEALRGLATHAAARSDSRIERRSQATGLASSPLVR